MVWKSACVARWPLMIAVLARTTLSFFRCSTEGLLPTWVVLKLPSVFWPAEALALPPSALMTQRAEVIGLLTNTFRLFFLIAGWVIWRTRKPG
jgi:hypothetical protein